MAGAAPNGDETLGRRAQQSFAGTVDQPEMALGVEGEDRHIDLVHHATQKRRCLQSTEALLAQGLAQHVSLEQGQPQWIVGTRGSGPDGVVALP